MDYAGLAEAAVEKVWRYRRDPDGWRGSRSTSEVSISWRPSEEFAGNLYRGEGIVPASTQRLWDFIKPEVGGLRTKWDKTVKDFELIEAVNDNVSIHRTTTSSALMGVISPREFVDVVSIKRYEDGTMLSAGTNVEHPLCLPRPNIVRGFNYACGCFCVPLPGEPDRTQLLGFFQTDVGGFLPQSVVETFIPTTITAFYSNLTKAVKSLKV